MDDSCAIKEKVSPRRGRLCEQDQVNNRALGRVVTQMMTSLWYCSPAVFNSLSRWVRAEECSPTNVLMQVLNVFLKDVPDNFRLPIFNIRALSNSIVNQEALIRADGTFLAVHPWTRHLPDHSTSL